MRAIVAVCVMLVVGCGGVAESEPVEVEARTGQKAAGACVAIWSGPCGESSGIALDCGDGALRLQVGGTGESFLCEPLPGGAFECGPALEALLIHCDG